MAVDSFSRVFCNLVEQLQMRLELSTFIVVIQGFAFFLYLFEFYKTFLSDVRSEKL